MLDPQPYAAAKAVRNECTERIVITGTLLHTTVVHYHIHKNEKELSPADTIGWQEFNYPFEFSLSPPPQPLTHKLYSYFL